MADIDQYYQMLEIQPGASLEEVKQAYRDLAFVWHPDRFAHNDRLQQKAQQRLTEISQAYQQLLLFLSQPELKTIEPQFQPPTPPAPVRENLNRKGLRKPAGNGNGKKGKKYQKATSKIQKGFKTQNRETFLEKRSNLKTTNHANPTSKRKKQFSTQYSKPRNFARETRKSQQNSSFPWWPLAIALASYALTGWILTKSAAPPVDVDFNPRCRWAVGRFCWRRVQ